MLELLRGASPELDRVQQNVAKELSRLDALLPRTRTPATYVTTDYLVKVTDALVLCTPIVAMNLTLPPAGPLAGLTFTIKNKSDPGVTVDVRGAFVNGASQPVDGVTPYALTVGLAITVWSTGTGWEVI